MERDRSGRKKLDQFLSSTVSGSKFSSMSPSRRDLIENEVSGYGDESFVKMFDGFVENGVSLMVALTNELLRLNIHTYSQVLGVTPEFANKNFSRFGSKTAELLKLVQEVIMEEKVNL
jgi:ribosome biogenesis protein Nip4